jgi:alanine racemase
VSVRIADRLAEAGLPPLPRSAWLGLDLDALAGNVAAVRAAVGPRVAILPVVKADAYGHGAIPIARALAATGVDGLCVAALDEAVALREAGLDVSIRVLYPPPVGSIDQAAAHHVVVAGGDVATLERILAAASAGPAGMVLDVDMEVDTGLGRGGLDPAQVVAAARMIDATPAARLHGLWTHLQASEESGPTQRQLTRFEGAAQAMVAAGIPVPFRHVAASGGILTGVPAYDGVRPGLAIYGLMPDELEDVTLSAAASALAAALRPVMSLHAEPVRVADVAVGEGVSYGPTWRAGRPSRVATLPLGYGDGYGRAFSNRGTALVRGKRVPIVGNVAMDAILVDVTDVPGSPVTTEDEFVLLGTQGGLEIRAIDLARERNTNRWEVVTQMAARLPRVYHAASAPVDLWTLTGR